MAWELIESSRGRVRGTQAFIRISEKKTVWISSAARKLLGDATYVRTVIDTSTRRVGLIPYTYPMQHAAKLFFTKTKTQGFSATEVVQRLLGQGVTSKHWLDHVPEESNSDLVVFKY